MTSAQVAIDPPGAAFTERFVEVDGFRIRYLEAGSGPPLVQIHGAGSLTLSKLHDLLAARNRVIAFEIPGFGQSPANDKSTSIPDLALTLAKAAEALGLERYNLMGTSFGGKLAVWIALQAPERIDALVLLAPAAVLPADWSMPPTPEATLKALWAHPERRPPAPPPDPAIAAKHSALLTRLKGLVRDEELENRLGEINIATLVLFGTQDGIVSPELGRVYRERMPNCNLVFVYDAGHALAAERPEALASVIDDFLERREAFVVSRSETMINP